MREGAYDYLHAVSRADGSSHLQPAGLIEVPSSPRGTYARRARHWQLCPVPTQLQDGPPSSMAPGPHEQKSLAGFSMQLRQLGEASGSQGEGEDWAGPQAG